MSRIDPEQLAELIFVSVKEVVSGPQIRGRFEAVEQRLAVLEPSTSAAPGSKLKARFIGPWAPHRTYDAHSAVALDRKLWVSMRTTSQPPDSPESGWQLVQDLGTAGR